MKRPGWHNRGPVPTAWNPMLVEDEQTGHVQVYMVKHDLEDLKLRAILNVAYQRDYSSSGHLTVAVSGMKVTVNVSGPDDRFKTVYDMLDHLLRLNGISFYRAKSRRYQV